MHRQLRKTKFCMFHLQARQPRGLGQNEFERSDRVCPDRAKWPMASTLFNCVLPWQGVCQFGENCVRLPDLIENLAKPPKAVRIAAGRVEYWLSCRVDFWDVQRRSSVMRNLHDASRSVLFFSSVLGFATVPFSQGWSRHTISGHLPT